MQPIRFFLLCLLAVVQIKAHADALPVPYAADRPLVEAQSTDLNWKDDARDREVPVRIYAPKEQTATLPVILFSHGLGGSREHYVYLGQQWAANGYICVHLQHPGSDDSVWRNSNGRPIEAMRRAANLENSVARAKDVSFAIDMLRKLNESDERFKGKLDLEHIGVSGHSFGGQTSFLIAGQQLGGRLTPKLPNLADPRVKAVIPMSPAVPEIDRMLDTAYAQVKIPVMVMSGTEDDSPIGNTTAEDRRKPFDHLPDGTPGYFLNLIGGDHMVFSGRARRTAKASDERHQQIIRLTSTAFWDKYLKSQESASKWLDGEEYRKFLKNDATMESKVVVPAVPGGR